LFLTWNHSSKAKRIGDGYPDFPMPFQILSLSGGGYLGLYTISVLAALEKKCGRPIAQSFDLIAGTSVGGIIALGLALEKPAAEIQAAFERNGEAIFSDRAAPRTRIGEMRDVMRYMNGPKYSDYNLRKTIIEITGRGHQAGSGEAPGLAAL
jgi:patatin-like phospholipase/acyl hydrolase